MKTLVTLTALLIFGWLAVVTFYGPELARAINGPEPVKAKVHRIRHAVVGHRCGQQKLSELRMC